MANPSHESTTTESREPATPINDTIVRQLIHGTGTDALVFYDVSDCHLHGRKYHRKLSGELASNARSAGYEPSVYQAILWFCVVYVPVWPLGTYFVMPFAEYDESHDEAVRYRGIRTNWDVAQVTHHCMAFATFSACTLLLIWCCCF